MTASPLDPARLARTSRFATLAIALGGLIGLGALALAANGIVDLNGRVEELRDELGSHTREISGLRSDVEMLKQTAGILGGERAEAGGATNPVSPDDVRATFRSTGKRDERGRTLYAYELWLVAPPEELQTIARVTWRAEHPLLRGPYTSTDARSGFRVAYEAPLCLPHLTVDLELVFGLRESLVVDQCDKATQRG
jgi:hypothetical protein